MTATDPRKRRNGLLIIGIAATLTVLTVAAVLLVTGSRQTGTAPASGQPARDFVLTGQDGKPFDSRSLRGKVMLVFFGFTHCPDVCPTTLQEMTNVMEALGPEANGVVPVFISVDPARDTPDVLAAFGQLFDPRIVMVTGPADTIADVAKAWHVYYKLQPPDASGNYAVDHSATVFLVDRGGQFRSTFDFHEDEKVILEKVRLLLAQ